MTDFRQDVQHLRGIAVLLVVAYHSGGLLPSGFVGVDIFFVISGYVIVRSVSAELSGRRFSLSAFLLRRIRRILPALAVMLAIVILGSSWLSSLSSRVQTVRTGIFATFGIANGFLYRFRPDGYFVESEKSNALLHTWSLGVEEQMYLAVGVAAALALLFTRSRFVLRQTTALLLLLATAVMSLMLCMVASYREIVIEGTLIGRLLGADEIDNTFAFYMPVTRAWQFLAGAIVAVVERRSAYRIESQWLRGIGFGLLLFSAFLAVADRFPNAWSILPVVGTMLVLASRPSSTTGSHGVGRLLTYLGDRSYSWYLWHWPLIQFVSPFGTSRLILLISALVALVPAELSFKFIEQPIRNGGSWRAPNRSLVLLGACLLLPMFAAGTSRNPHPELENHLDVQRDCVYGEINRLAPNGPCVVSTPDSRGIAALIGDSHASHLSEAFVAASHSLGYDAMLASRANNPFLFREGVTENGSSELERQLVSHLVDSGVKLVVLAQAMYSNVNYLPGQSWYHGMLPILQTFSNAGIPVVLVGESVNVGVDPLECSALQISLSQCPADVLRSTVQLKANRGRTAEEFSLAAQLRRVVLFDWADELCPMPTCEIYRDGYWLWRDNGHISIHASELLSEPLENAMRAALTD